MAAHQKKREKNTIIIIKGINTYPEKNCAATYTRKDVGNCINMLDALVHHVNRKTEWKGETASVAISKRNGLLFSVKFSTGFINADSRPFSEGSIVNVDVNKVILVLRCVCYQKCRGKLGKMVEISMSYIRHDAAKSGLICAVTAIECRLKL